MTERTVHQLYFPVEAVGKSQEQEAELVARVRSKEEWQHFTPEFIDTQEPLVKIGDLQRVFRESQRVVLEGKVSQTEATVKFATHLPVGLFFIGDVHFGSVQSDHDRFFKDIKRIEETPNAYIVLMGNLIDNAIPAQFPANMLNNFIPPDKQVIGMRKIVRDLDEEGKVVGAVGAPCHEGWSWTHAGQDVNNLIFGYDGRHFPVLENGGMLHLRFPKARYEVALYHQTGPFESNFNETHAVRQMNRLNLNMEADVVAGAHRHYAAAEQVFEGLGEKRKPVCYLRTGTYKGIGKLSDSFSRERRGSTGEPSGQSVIFWPDRKRMEPQLEFETGILAQQAHYLTELSKKS